MLYGLLIIDQYKTQNLLVLYSIKIEFDINDMHFPAYFLIKYKNQNFVSLSTNLTAQDKSLSKICIVFKCNSFIGQWANKMQ